MKPTKSQKKFLDSIYSTITGAIQSYNNQIQLLNHIELRLTKDGKPRKVFEDNFGLTGLPTKTDLKFAVQKHYVLVSVTNEAWLADVAFWVNVKFMDINSAVAELAGVPAQSGHWIAFKVDHKPASPEETLAMIRTAGVKFLKEQIAKAKKDLRTAKSEKFVQTVLNIGNSFRQFRNSVRQFRKFCMNYDTSPELYSFKHMITSSYVLDLITK